MAIEAEENARAFDVAFTWQMHAPMHVLISRIIKRERDASAADQTPFTRRDGNDEERQFAEREENWTVPPRHWDRLLVVLVDQVVSVVGFENLVVHQGVSFEWISKISDRFMHQKAV